MPSKSRRYIFLLVLFICTSSSAQFISSPSEAFGDRLDIGMVGEPPENYNPFQIDDITKLQMARLIFGTGLVQQPGRFGDSPSLVDRFKYPEDEQLQGIVWKYVLKRNINYQNGIPLRNSDVLFTFDLLRKWGGHILNRDLDFSNISAIELNGDLEFQFILKEKDEDFDLKLTDIPVLSRNYYEEILRGGYDVLKVIKPLGYGPFKFEENTQNRVSLQSHPNYVFGRPFLNGVAFKFYPDEQLMTDDFIRGNLDLIEIDDRITAQRLHQILKNEIKIFATPRPEKKVYFILLNVNRFPFNNSKNRQAIRSAINLQEITSRLVEQNGRIAYSILDFTDPLFFKDLLRENYHPGISMRILSENGWRINRQKGLLEKNGNDFSFELIFEKNSYLEESLARAVKIHLAEVGINVQPKPVEPLAKKELIDQNNYTAIIHQFSYYNDDLFKAIRIFYSDILKNRNSSVNFSSRTMERLFTNAAKNPSLRRQVIQRFQIVLHQETPVIFLFFNDKIIYAVNNRFQDIRVSQSRGNIYYHRLNPFENWYVPKSLQKYSDW